MTCHGQLLPVDVDFLRAFDQAMAMNALLPLADRYAAARKAFVARGGSAVEWKRTFDERRRRQHVTMAMALRRSAGPAFADRPTPAVGDDPLAAAVSAIERFGRVSGEWRPRVFPPPPAPRYADASGALLGVRGWRVMTSKRGGPVLVAVTQAMIWPRGVAVARCGLQPGGCSRPAGWDCICGIYAFNGTPQAREVLGLEIDAIGLVRAWGRVAIHRLGWRAEFVQPVWLAVVTERDETAAALGAHYECDAVAVASRTDALAAVASREQEMERWPA